MGCDVRSHAVRSNPDTSTANRSLLQTRWSGQIYLEMDDYVKAAEVLKTMCERAKKGEYLQDVRPS